MEGNFMHRSEGEGGGGGGGRSKKGRGSKEVKNQFTSHGDFPSLFTIHVSLSLHLIIHGIYFYSE